MTTTTTLTLSRKQAQIVRDALSMYFRMGMGQLDVAVTEFLAQHQLFAAEQEKLDEVSGHVAGIKAVLGHHPNGSWGIHNPDVAPDCYEAYQIYKHITHEGEYVHGPQCSPGSCACGFPT